MPRQFAYYPGCVAEFSSKELNATTKALAPLLDIELLPMPQATCCGAGDVAQAKPNLYLTLNVRILSEAESMGVDILTICNVCTLNLRRANKMVKEDSRVLEAVNEELVKAGARPYQGTIEVTHLLWFLATEEGLSLLEARGPEALARLYLDGWLDIPEASGWVLRAAETLAHSLPEAVTAHANRHPSAHENQSTVARVTAA